MANDDYAVIVGIDDYIPPTFNPLQGAKNDATDFLAWVKSPTGGDVPASHVDPYVKLSAISPRGPRLSDLYELIEAIMAQPPLRAENTQIGRRLYLFFAGHGLSDGDIDEGHLVTAEAGRVMVPTLPGRYSANVFAAAALFEEIVLFMDCCRVPRLTLKAPGTIPAAVLEDADAAGKARRFYVFATPYGQVAREAVHGGTMHGIFSRVLIDGLRGAATDNKGEITTSSLRRHLEERLGVPAIAQNPKFPSSDEIVLVAGGVPRVESVTVTLIPSTDHLEVFDGATLSPIAEPPMTVVVQLDGSRLVTLPAGKIYLFCATGSNGSKRYHPWKADGGESHVTF